MAVQQLSAAPFPAEVGSTVTVRAVRDDQPLRGERIAVVVPDGRRVACGETDGTGVVAFVPEVPGQYVFEMTVGGVRIIAPHRVVPARQRWLAAFVCVPLGLALLWQNLRRRDLRAPTPAALPQASTRST